MRRRHNEKEINMKIDMGLIGYLEKLSKLKLTDEERLATMEQLGQILEYFDTLQGLDTENVEELSHPLALANAFREDEVTESIDRQSILANTPKQKDGYFQVPKTVE